MNLFLQSTFINRLNLNNSYCFTISFRSNPYSKEIHFNQDISSECYGFYPVYLENVLN